ncbi:ABC-three component system middle component 1 [Pedobacter frigoris]|uniref:ABC-three component system middle component 1 n=1 Tax=Pedobacter frigoris TaxID=2571272 RepID=UPI0029316722|nr:ABC-three component system middle component 1 [Pedobacter frigoris]
MTEIIKFDFLIDHELVDQQTLSCWKRESDRFNIYFFTCTHDSVADLLESYTRIRDYIAIYFQGDFLKLDVERWNIYQFHLLTSVIDPNVKQTIEQDKFATRKIVLDGLSEEITDDVIKKLIDVELFQFFIQRRMIQHVSILDVLDQQDREVASYLRHENPSRDEMISSLLKAFGNGEN